MSLSSVSWLLLLFLAACGIVCRAAIPELNDADIQKWTADLEQGLRDVLTQLKVSQLDAAFKAASVQTVSMNEAAAKKLLDDTKTKLETFIGKTEKQVEKIRQAAESAYANHSPANVSCSTLTDFPYLRATAVVAANSNSTNGTMATRANANVDYCSSEAELVLTKDPRLFELPTNRHFSTAHVPPNIFDASNSILNIANWSASLDAVFKQNAASDPTVKWQYFGATDGMMKLYPGVRWHLQAGDYLTSEQIDFFDCRAQSWYLLAATYPKDVVILLDNSGSMKGSRSIIANKTVTDLLSTLTPNDYFNLLVFMNNSVRYVSDLHNRTLRQATEFYKFEVLELITQDQHRGSIRLFPPYGISDHRVALTEAFELLKMAKEGSVTSSGGVQAIVIITDASPEAFPDVFEAYNKEKQVRVIAYLIGQEASDLATVRDIACSNRGYFAQIFTLADVKEHVQQWVDVLATTNAMDGQHFSVWTAVHTSQVVTQNMPEKERRRLFTSVAQAAYDIGNSSANRQTAALIGVAGIEVPIDQLQRLAPDWQLGALAYIFLITNNGHVLLHPEYRLLDSAGHLNTFYENKDIAEIEYPVSDSLQYETANYSLPLRDAMINGRTGSVEMTRLKTAGTFARGFRQKYKYFYSPLMSPASSRASSLSLGLAVPWATGGRASGVLQYPSGTKADSLTDSELTATLANGVAAASCSSANPQRLLAGVGDYEFCDFPPQLLSEFNANPLCCLAAVLRLNASEQARINCEQRFLRRLLLDASATKTVADSWKTFDTGVRDKFGIGIVFLWTETGLARWLTVGPSLDEAFALRHRNGSREPLYEAAWLLNAAAPSTPKLSLTPPTAAAVAAGLSTNSSSSFPVYLTAPIRTETRSQLGVAGAEVNSWKLAAELLRVASTCAGAGACANCSQLGVRCYLVDTGAFVVASELPAELGQSLGRVECAAMQVLLQRQIFLLTRAYDYQSVCQRVEAISAAGSTLFSPLRSFGQLVSWLLTESLLLLLDAGSWLLQMGPSAADGVMAVNGTSYTTEVISGCHSYKLATANSAKLPAGSTQTVANASCESVNTTCSCGNCNSNIYVRPLANTNLIFVAVATDAGGCSCSGCRNPLGEDSLTQQPHELQQPPRVTPAWCPATIVLKDNTTVCSTASKDLQPPTLLMLLLLLTMLAAPRG